MGIHQKLASFYNKQVSSPSTSQVVPARRRRPLPKDSSSSASSYSSSSSSSDSDDFRNARAGNNSAIRADDYHPRRPRSHDDNKYPRIGYFHPQSNFIRARFPTPRGPQPKIEAFTSTAGQAGQLSALPCTPVRPFSAVVLSKPVKESSSDSQDGRHDTIKSVLTFGYRKRRRYGHGDEAKCSRAPMLPPIRFFSGGSLHILDNIGNEEKMKGEDPNLEQVSVATKVPREKLSEEMDTTQEDDFDTEEAIARLNIIVAASVAEASAAQKSDDVPTLWRRLSQKGRASPQPNGEPSVKFNLPSPTMLNTYDQTAGFVNIPVASVEGSRADHNKNTILLSTVSHDISDDDFLIESPKSKISKLENGNPGISPSRKLSHVSTIFHCASETIRGRARDRQHGLGNIGVDRVIGNGNVDTDAATGEMDNMADTTTALGNSEPTMSYELSKLSKPSGSFRSRDKAVDSADASFFRRLKLRVRAFVSSRAQRTSIRTIKPDVPDTVQIERLYSTVDDKTVASEDVDDESKSARETNDDKLKDKDTAPGTTNQRRVIHVPVIDTSNLSPSDWDQMTPGTQTTFVSSPTSPVDVESPKKSGTVRFNNVVEIMGEDDSFVIVETPIMRTPTRDDPTLPVDVLLPPAVQQPSSPISNASDPFCSPIVTSSESGSTLVSPRLL
ncbi:uncharacterized protein V1513DRAFT_158416 [Lipomyces chichibuensis]|uniref:uncharacterized protein n=1 Tax=Lipomyces chichibuensis TaxID=1546026 RepID=UPI003343EF39